MSSSYDFQGGSYDPVTQTDVVPEMEADYANIERSENEFFQSLRENDRNMANEAGSKLKSLSTLLNLDNHLINLKGKTVEKLGLIGKEEAIACEVIVCLNYYA